MTGAIVDIRKKIIHDSIRTACENTPGSDVEALLSRNYHRIIIHNNMINQQIVRFKKYAARNISIPELPPEFFTSLHCSEIFRELDNEYSNKSDDDTSIASFEDSDDEDTIRCGIKYWICTSNTWLSSSDKKNIVESMDVLEVVRL